MMIIERLSILPYGSLLLITQKIYRATNNTPSTIIDTSITLSVFDENFINSKYAIAATIETR
ncbi:MAG: hypothetical protein IJ150_00160 [Bacteroidales bacterium]|nr:hypothetical protein [Bacteroidales bacterium]